MTLEELFAKRKEPSNYVEKQVTEPNKLQQFFAERTPVPKEIGKGLQPDYSYGMKDEVATKSAAPKEIAQPLKPDIAVVSEEAPKIPQERVDALKAMYSADTPTSESMPQAENVAAPTQQTGVMPTQQEGGSTSSYEEKIKGMMPQVSNQDLLLGMIPVAMDALSGGYGQGLDVAGKYYGDKVESNDKRRMSLEDKLLELDKAKYLAAAKSKNGLSKRFVAQNIELDDGTVVKGSMDTALGSYHYADGTQIPGNKVKAGYALTEPKSRARVDYAAKTKKEVADYLGTGTRLDPNSGELGIVRNGRITPITGSQVTEYTNKQQKDIKEMTNEITKSPAYADSVNSLTVAPVVNSLLDAAQRTKNPNSVAGKSVVLTMVRQAQKVGVASDKDAAALGGTEQWNESLIRLTNKLTGQGESLTMRDIQELREISDIYAKRSKSLLTDYYTQQIPAYSKRFGLKEAQIKEQLDPKISPYINLAERDLKSNVLPEGVSFGGGIHYPPKKNPHATVPIEVDGGLNWIEPSDWKEIQKEYPKAKRLK